MPIFYRECIETHLSMNSGCPTCGAATWQKNLAKNHEVCVRETARLMPQVDAIVQAFHEMSSLVSGTHVPVKKPSPAPIRQDSKVCYQYPVNTHNQHPDAYFRRRRTPTSWRRGRSALLTVCHLLPSRRTLPKHLSHTAAVGLTSCSRRQARPRERARQDPHR